MASKKSKASRPASQAATDSSSSVAIDHLVVRIASIQAALDDANARIAALEARPVHYCPTQPLPASPWWCFWSSKDAAN